MRAGMIPVNAEAMFGTQCQYGMPSEPMPVFLGLWDCQGLNTEALSLEDPFEPIYFSADCQEMYLTVRTLNGDLDSTWKIPPDGKFDIYMDASEYKKSGSVFKVSTDGMGGACATYAQLNVWGEMRCKERTDDSIDQVELDVKVRWNLGVNLDKDNKPEMPEKWLEQAGIRECHMPDGCYMFSEARLHQCR